MLRCEKRARKKKRTEVSDTAAEIRVLVMLTLHDGRVLFMIAFRLTIKREYLWVILNSVIRIWWQIPSNFEPIKYPELLPSAFNIFLNTNTEIHDPIKSHNYNRPENIATRKKPASSPINIDWK